ncbi:MAG: diguanylate cyclase [Erysipelotrichaceae bacterium]|nr:diguanylate cyclase [Erysipelotrichaceae bacterium]
MRSIAKKLITLILVTTIITILTVGGLAIYRLEVSMNRDSNKILNLTCEDKTHELNSTLEAIEQSVDTIAKFAVDNLENPDSLRNEAEFDYYVEHLYHLSYTVANETPGSNSIYFRFNHELTNSTAGFFLTKDYNTGLHSINAEKTDLSKYPANDTNNVGWYYIPYNSGKPTWLKPYHNVVSEDLVISYVNPIFVKDVFIGVVGMDIDFSVLTNIVDDILLYETGFSFLTDSNLAVIHSKEDLSSVEKMDVESSRLESDDIIFSYKINKRLMKISFRELSNGMYLAVTAPKTEINKSLNTLVTQVVIMLVVLTAIFTGITIAITHRIVQPLKSITNAANEIANGNLDIDIDCNSNDEVGVLAKAMSETVKMLKIRVDYIENLAKLDKLTGIYNNTSYQSRVEEIEDEVKYGLTSYAVFIIDLNGLKSINDSFGHQAGNELIIETARIISSVFGNENSYRIGGDEFAVILSGCDNASSKLFYSQFEKRIKGQKGKIKPKVAVGYEVFNPELFSSYDEVFKSADKKMYENKELLKSKGINSKVN